MELEKELPIEAKNLGLGAQFGGNTSLTISALFACHVTRILPVGMGVSCSAYCNIKASIHRQGIWIESLKHNPGDISRRAAQSGRRRAVCVDLNRPMKEILAESSQYPFLYAYRLTPRLSSVVILLTPNERADG
ncbi:hypothetical protein ACNKHP_00660 [Shigella boydii]